MSFARNVGINGGRFFTVNGDYNNISIGSGAFPVQLHIVFYVCVIQPGTAAGIQTLSQAISHGVMHDSSERDPSPRGTRKKVTDDVIHWLEDPETSTSVLWVNGRAAVGKSAVMQTITR